MPPHKLNIPSYWSNNKYAVSNSRLNILLECPLRHYFQYVLGMRVDKDIPAIHMGSAIHAVLEAVHADEGFSTQKEAIQFAHTIWENNWKEMKQAGLAVGDKRTSYESNLELGKLLLIEYIKNFRKGKPYKTVRYQYPDDPKSKPAVEIPFRIPMVDLPSGELIVDGYDLYGLIDLISLIDELPHVLDHKVLSIKPKPLLLEFDLQLVIYGYVLLFLVLKGVIQPTDAMESIDTKNPKIHVAFNHMLKPYKGPDWSNKRSAPTYERNGRLVTWEEIKGVLHIIRDAIRSFETSWDRACPSYGEHCTWKCDLVDVCKAHRLMQDPVEAFEKAHGVKLDRKSKSNQILDEDELF